MDLDKTLDQVTQDDINNVVVSMRRSGLAHNSVSSYTRVLRTFLKWCRGHDYTTVVMPPIKDKETVKETYTDEELQALIKSIIIYRFLIVNLYIRIRDRFAFHGHTAKP